MNEDDKLSGLGRIASADSSLWSGTSVNAEGPTLTMELIQAAWDKARNAEPKPYVRYVSSALYKRAMDAQKEGANGIVIEALLQGWSREQAEEISRRFKEG